MRFRHQREAPMPVVDLIPMLNVMMGVLAFFVAVSMTLAAAPDGVDVDLPSGQGQPVNTGQLPPNLLLGRALADGRIETEGKQLTEEQFLARIEQHLGSGEEAEVVLIANPDVAYENVIQLLAALRAVGGDRVSLGVESP